MNLFTSVDITLADIHVAPTEQSATISSPGSPSPWRSGDFSNQSRPTAQ
jgi:hypothetical protein